MNALPGRRTHTGDVALIESMSMPEPNTGCWLWIGTIATNGYAQYGRNNHGHRLAYEVYVGEVKNGHHVHHTCETRSCVNPAHLVALSPGDHIRETLRINGKDYLWRNRERPTVCRKGHSLADAYVLKGGKERRCRQCQKDTNARRYKKASS